MKIPRSAFPATALVVFLLNGALLPHVRAAQPKEELLIDFTDNHRDSDGTVFHAYEYTFEDWSKHVTDLRGRGVLIKALTGKGGLGENKTMVDFAGCTSVELQFVIGNANQATAINFSLEDKDGTEQSWTIPLAEKPHGRALRQRFDLSKADNEAKPGKKPGMDLKKIITWQVRGDWSAPNVEVLLIKLTGEK